MKKTALISFLALACFFFALGVVQARAGCPTEGLVPCGTPSCPCKLCDFFVMINRIINFVLFRIVPVLAALMIAIGGFMYIAAYTGMAGEGPEMLSRAKKVFFTVAIGLLIAYGAWLIVNTFMWFIGVASWTGLREGWWRINCN